MSDGEGDNEYEALMKKNFERKQALLAELGLDDLLNEGRQFFTEIRDRNKPRQPVRRKSDWKEKPARRSVRIQKKSHKVKYVKGFRGFDDTRGQKLSNYGEECDVEPTDRLNSRGRKSQNSEYHTKVQIQWHSKFLTKHAAQDNDPENCNADYRKRKHKESEDQENNNEISDLYVEKSDTEKTGSLGIVENVNKTVSEIKIENEVYDTPNKDTCGLVSSELGLCDAPVVKNMTNLSGNKDHALPKEKLMETVDKPSILNNYSNSGLLDHVADYQDTEWNNRSEVVCKQIILKYFQRSVQFKNHDEETDSEDDWSKYENVMFCISASEDSDDSYDDCDENNKVSRTRRRISNTNYCYDVPKISCEDVTDAMLANIVKRSSCKVYDQLNGTTCHQCRQKTLDTKTVCRSGRCVGVRGMFCGICLPKRYGEQVADALKTPDWECPVCRGICNCSFCRARAGKNPTGIMYPEALQHGYTCVAEYLKDKDDKENIRTKEKKFKILKC